MDKTSKCPHCGWDLQDQDDAGAGLIKCPQCGQEVSLAAEAPQTIPGYYTLVEAAAVVGLTQRGAEKAASREGWKPFQAGNVHLYRANDIHRYRDHRRRTKLVKALGWRGRGLYRNDDIDMECPECGGFAVEWPAPPKLSEKFVCLEEHEGEL